MIQLWLMLVFLFLSLILGRSSVIKDSHDLTPTATYAWSLFPDATCTPPCWLSLVPGKSTSREVVSVLQARKDIVDLEVTYNSTVEPKTNYVINGDYGFIWSGTAGNGIVVRGRVISWIELGPPDVITLDQVIRRLGQPDRVIVMNTLYNFLLYLFYDSYDTVFQLDVIGSVTDKVACNLSKIGNIFYVYNTIYYVQERWDELSRFYGFDFGVSLPLKVWNEWLSGKVKDSCADAVTRLYVDAEATATQAAALTQTPLTATPAGRP